jgi:hypothetical protein
MATFPESEMSVMICCHDSTIPTFHHSTRNCLEVNAVDPEVALAVDVRDDEAVFILWHPSGVVLRQFHCDAIKRTGWRVVFIGEGVLAGGAFSLSGQRPGAGDVDPDPGDEVVDGVQGVEAVR